MPVPGHSESHSQSNTVPPSSIMGHLKHNLKLLMSHLTRRRDWAPGSSVEAAACQNKEQKMQGDKPPSLL